MMVVGKGSKACALATSATLGGGSGLVGMGVFALSLPLTDCFGTVVTVSAVCSVSGRGQARTLLCECVRV